MRSTLISVYKQVVKDIAESNSQLNKLAEELGISCRHEITHSVTKTKTNSYGSLRTVNYLFCQICQAENYYGQWIKQEHISRGDDY